MKTKSKKEIVSIEFCIEQDDNPDLSFLGKYTNAEEPGAIERKNRGRGEYWYFIPAMTGEQTGNQNSPQQDFERMESYNDGDWCMTFCYAKAIVAVGGVRQTIRSAGLCGVESDSDRGYLEEIMKEELLDLKGILQDLGFQAKAIREKLKDACVPH